MATPSVIGSLRVVLGADSAAFDKGLKGANTSLNRFAKTAGRAAAALATAMVGAALALGVAVRNTLKEMDNFAKTAQQIGVPVRELAGLTHAAEVAGVEFAGLTKGIQKLGRSVVEAAQGLQTPIRAFKTLGIEVRDTNGNLKSTSALIPELADKFASMPDGPEKTAAAMQLLGRQGANMIPMLNLGSAGIKKLTDEAEKLGIVMSTETAQAAERFNDSMLTLGKVWTGFVTQVTAALAGPLANVAEAFHEMAVEAGGFADAGQRVGKWMVGLIDIALRVAMALQTISRELAVLAKAADLLGQAKLGAAWETLKGLPSIAAETRAEFDKLRALLTAPLALSFEQMTLELNKTNIETVNFTEQAKAAAQAQRDLNSTLAEGLSVFQSTRTPLEAYALQLEDLSRLLKAGAIDAETFGRAQTMAAASAVQPWLNVASTIGGALGTLFDDNKKVAIAQALINVAQGVTAALAQYPPPLSFAMAAAQAAAGAAQIATIKSTRPGSGGSAKRPAAGGGSGRNVDASSGPINQSSLTINIEGDGFLSRRQLENVMEQIMDAQRDGAKIILAA